MNDESAIDFSRGSGGPDTSRFAPRAHWPREPKGTPPFPLYYFIRALGRFVFFCTMRVQQTRPELADTHGGYVLALTHLGHLDPFCAGILLRRRIRWMTRQEFFCNGLATWILSKAGAFSVNRQGIPVRAVRTAIECASHGEVVGICPEGGRVERHESVVHGGVIKQGVCSIAIRARVPVIPCVMLDSDNLTTVAPWLPFRHGRIRTIYGQPLMPPPGPSTRAKRHAFREQLCAAFQDLYRELSGG